MNKCRICHTKTKNMHLCDPCHRIYLSRVSVDVDIYFCSKCEKYDRIWAALNINGSWLCTECKWQYELSKLDEK